MMILYRLGGIDVKGLLETINFNLISGLGLLIAFIEIILIRIQLKQDKKAIRIQHSIEIAKDFQRLVDNELSFVTSVFELFGNYDEVIRKINRNSMHNFDITEFNHLKKDISGLDFFEEYIEKNRNDFYKTVALVYLSKSKTSIEEFETLQLLNAHDWDSKKIKSIKQDGLIKKYNYYRNELVTTFDSTNVSVLNQLEAFAMSINTELADENIVYKSLHQVFLNCVMLEYPIICKLNESSKADKYYSYTIELYNRWNKRRNDDLEAFKDNDKIDSKTKF